MVKPQKGNVSLDDNIRIAYVPQEPILFDHLSIYDNATFFKNIKARRKEFDPLLFKELSKVLGLNDEILYSNKKISQLSGGQKRKLSLLKALSLNPNILLLDEPTTGLDAQVKMELLSQLKKLAHKYRIQVLYITHHFEEAVFIGDKLHYLLKENGSVINEISTQTMGEFKMSPPSLEAAYLVDFPKNTIKTGDFEGEAFKPSDNGELYQRVLDGDIQYYNKYGNLITENK
jgi:ABC-type multidrug transport system ATPase subunit